jgi:hypothetical protein
MSRQTGGAWHPTFTLNGYSDQSSEGGTTDPGATMLDYMATRFLAALLSNPEITQAPESFEHLEVSFMRRRAVCDLAIEMATELLAQLGYIDEGPKEANGRGEQQ